MPMLWTIQRLRFLQLKSMKAFLKTMTMPWFERKPKSKCNKRQQRSMTWKRQPSKAYEKYRNDKPSGPISSIGRIRLGADQSLVADRELGRVPIARVQQKFLSDARKFDILTKPATAPANAPTTTQLHQHGEITETSKIGFHQTRITNGKNAATIQTDSTRAARCRTLIT